MNISQFNEKFKNKKCDVLGFGTSNRPLVKMLADAGALVTVRDKNTSVCESREACEISEKNVKFIVGENYLENIDADYIFRSPGIRPDEKNILHAVKNGAVLCSEMELFFELSPVPIYGITGSDGKTTTTTLTHLFLQAQADKNYKGKSYVGGNIGAPLLPHICEMTDADNCTVELSSFQLMTMKVSPVRAVITNITPNHLNWHTDMDEYIASKCNIFMHKPISLLVTNAENDITFEIARNTDIPVIYFSSKRSSYESIVPEYKKNCRAIYESDGIIYIDDGQSREELLDCSSIILPGRHNIENYMAAMGITYGLVDKEIYTNVAKGFNGVRHRLELIRELDGVKYYNSSIDSSPTRTAAAISALPKKPIIICGGYDKKIPFDTLASSLIKGTKSVILTGATAEKIFNELKNNPDFSLEELPTVIVPDFKDAVIYAKNSAKSGDIVLLSPACASFDAFKNFEERGDYFREIVSQF